MKDRHKKTRRAAAHLPPLSPDDASALQEHLGRLQEALAAGTSPETLQNLVPPRPDDLDWDLHLIQGLGKIPHAGIPAILAAFFGPSVDKERRKAVKKALHALKTRGIPVPAELFSREEAVTSATPEASALQAQVSSIFGNGERYVILEGPREVLGGSLLVARLSDQHGIRECHLLTLKRKQREEFWEQFHGQGLDAWAEVPPAYVLRLLEEALALTPDGDPSRDAYLPLRENLWRHIGRPEDAPALSEVLPSLSPGERGGYLEQSRKLATSELCRSWLPSPEEVVPWIEKLKQAQESVLVLTEAQQRLRQEGVLDDATAALFPQENRSRWSRRLLEMAYFLDLSGRAEEARAAQAAGEDLLSGERSAISGENPFLQELVRYALMLAWEFLKQQEPQPQTSPLLAPSTEPLIRR
jgi:hypothetical protein